MKTTYQASGSGGLALVDQAQRNSWVHVVAPDPGEIAYLSDELGIPESFIQAGLDVSERSRFDREGGCSLAVVLLPTSNGTAAGAPFSTVPLAVVLTPDRLVTVCVQDVPLVRQFAAQPKTGISTAKRNRLILQLFMTIAQAYLADLRLIDQRVDQLQAQVQVSLRNRELVELLRYQKSLIYFRTALSSNSLMLRRLTRSGIFDAYPDDADLLEDVLTENEQAVSMTAISSDILNQMMDAYASIISNNVNDVLRVLALATIMLAIPTVIASLYGMNVPLPGQGSEWAYETILGAALAGMAATFVLFWRRRWL